MKKWNTIKIIINMFNKYKQNIKFKHTSYIGNNPANTIYYNYYLFNFSKN